MRYLSQELTRLQVRRKRKRTGDKSEGGCAEYEGGLGEGGGKRERCGGPEVEAFRRGRYW